VARLALFNGLVTLVVPRCLGASRKLAITSSAVFWVSQNADWDKRARDDLAARSRTFIGRHHLRVPRLVLLDPLFLAFRYHVCAPVTGWLCIEIVSLLPW
jgi:hypothetical protein